jgi:epoxyqueuosine reductase
VSIEERESLRAEALALGFLQVGFAAADPPRHSRAFLDWLDRDMHGEMGWMARPDAVERRLDPRFALPGCRTLVMVTMSYAPASEPVHPASEPLTPGVGSDSGENCRAIVARYAAGRDYHLEFEERLSRLADRLKERWPEAGVKSYVDYGPVLERDHAQRAGLGWVGKNTMLIHPEFGSWTLIGELLTTREIPPDDPFTADRCGTCARCIEACPTGAIVEPRRLDARLCISYLTIELKGPIPVSLRRAIGTRIFGCDICQEVCPWNHGASTGSLPAESWGGPVPPDAMESWAEELLDLSEAEFRSRYDETVFARPGRDGLLRNLCVGLGNGGRPSSMPILLRCFEGESALVREHAAWAIGRLDADRAG